MPVGNTEDAGWQIGVSKTIHHPVATVWNALASAEGVELWLGAGVHLGKDPGQPVRSSDGGVGEIRSHRPEDRVRLR